MFSIFHRHLQNNLHSTFLPPQNRRSAEQLNFCGFANRQKKAFRICYFLWYRTNTRKMSENRYSLVGFKSEDDDVRHFSSKEIQDFSDDHWNWGLVLGMSKIKFRSFLTLKIFLFRLFNLIFRQQFAKCIKTFQLFRQTWRANSKYVPHQQSILLRLSMTTIPARAFSGSCRFIQFQISAALSWTIYFIKMTAGIDNLQWILSNLSRLIFLEKCRI